METNKTLSMMTVAFAVAFLAGGPAWAKAVKCSELPARLQAKCNQQVAKDCAGVTGYWPKRRCEEKVVAGLDTCTSPEAKKLCQALKKDRFGACWDNLVNTKKWFAALKAYPEMKKRLDKITPMFKDCKEYGGCKRSDVKSCYKVSERFKKDWAFHINNFLKSRMNTAWSQIDSLAKGKFYGNAASTARRTIVKINKLLEINKNPAIRANDTALKALIPKLEKKAAEMDAKAKKALASVRCPARGKARGNWVELVKTHLAKHNPRVKETIKRFSLHGKRTKTYRGILKNVVREHQGGVVCVKRVKEDKQTDCFILYVKYSRQKHVREKRWGAWIIERFHNNTPMLCKNLR